MGEVLIRYTLVGSFASWDKTWHHSRLLTLRSNKYDVTTSMLTLEDGTILACNEEVIRPVLEQFVPIESFAGCGVSYRVRTPPASWPASYATTTYYDELVVGERKVERAGVNFIMMLDDCHDDAPKE